VFENVVRLPPDGLLPDGPSVAQASVRGTGLTTR
jgi:hypothetical protein